MDATEIAGGAASVCVALRALIMGTCERVVEFLPAGMHVLDRLQGGWIAGWELNHGDSLHFISLARAQERFVKCVHDKTHPTQDAICRTGSDA